MSDIMNDELDTMGKSSAEAVSVDKEGIAKRKSPIEGAKTRTPRRKATVGKSAAKKTESTEVETKDVAIKESAPKKPSARKRAKTRPTTLEQDALTGQAQPSIATSPVDKACVEGEENTLPQSERRGRGLRAIVSRNRRKNSNKREDLSSKEELKEPHKERQSKNRSSKPFSDGDLCFEQIVSGQFDDAWSSTEGRHQKKRVLSPEPESPKLHKVLAQAGMGSRLEMEAMILQGRISVNSEPAHIGQRIQFGDQVRINGRLIKVQIEQPAPRVLVYHKPVGEIVTHDDPQKRPTVFRKLPRLKQGKWLSIGRLDINTEGLLLFTNSGEVANSLMHPRFGVEREYAVRVLGGLSDEDKQMLLDGVELEDGRAHFKALVDGGGEGANQWYRVVIAEGRNREVRRMIESCGKVVSRLIRIRYGAVTLPPGLKQGSWSEISGDELQGLGHLLGGKAKALINGTHKNNADNKGTPKNKNFKRDASRKGRSQNNGVHSERNYNSNQPDPMRTSLGYIEHEAILPSFSKRERSGSNGSQGRGAGARKNNRNNRNSRSGY